MTSSFVRRLCRAGVCVVAAGALSCASEREPINQVQANALDKKFFVGAIADSSDDPVFYWRNFVVDGSDAQFMIGVGSWSGVDRIRWEITENMLFARRAYPQAEGTRDKGGEGPADGALVAAYPIKSHFDIKRAYNSSTGEELNVIEENTSDRVWSEREFFRVDWSINLVDTPLWYDMFVGKLFGEITVTPISYYANDKGNPDAPHFVPEEGYFDVTSKFFVGGKDVNSPAIQQCWIMGVLGGLGVDSCDPQEAVIRSSYWRVDQVDPDGDYEPFENTRATLDIIGNPGGLGDSLSAGIVTPPRIEWDPQYGFTDPSYTRFMHRHNIWKQSHQTKGSCETDADCSGEGFKAGSVCLPSGACTVPCNYDARQDNGAGTDVQCENGDTGYEGSSGSQCSARNRCTIPFRDREIQPVGYWMNKETPEELTDEVDESTGEPVSRGPTEDLIYTWNQALEFSVAKAREVECRRTGDGSRAECHEQYFEPGRIDMVSMGGWGMEQVKDMDDVLVACHNPVREYDNHEVCGETGYAARVGDLRHNFLFYWPHHSRAPWGGIANWNADPLTGQIIGASATTMGRSATFSAAMNRDLIMVANGELEFNDIVDGVPASRFEKRLREGYLPKTFTKAEIDQRVSSIDAEHAMQTIGPAVPEGTLRTKIDHYLDQITKKVAIQGMVSPVHAQFEALANKIRGTVFEAQLMDPNYMIDAMGWSPNTDLNDAMLEHASPLRSRESGNLARLIQLRDLGYQARGICFPEPMAGEVGNLDVQGVARYFAEKYADESMERRAELIYRDLWIETYKGIQLHEIGHSLGMLHQFASSYDSPNYNPQYWQLRTQEGQATESCEGQPRTGDTYLASRDTCMGPRYLDPETDDELGRGDESRPGIKYFGHTSTMEYQNERFFENVGLGQYDLLTMGVLYGSVLQTFDPDSETGLTRSEQEPFAARHLSQLTDYELVNYQTPEVGSGIQPMHYTEQARRMRLFDADRCREATEEEIERAEWRIVHGKVCAHPPKDFAFWDDFESSNLLKWRVRDSMGAAAGNVRWPYRWGVTSNAYLHTNPSDAGADVYEVTQETLRKFDYAYPFRYFRRQSREWNFLGVPSVTAGQFFERLRSYHWGIAADTAYFRSFGEDDYQVLSQSDNWWRPYLLAGADMFEAISRALLIPEVGGFGSVGTPIGQSRPLYHATNERLFTIDAVEGRYIYPSVDSSPSGGGSWDYWNWIHHTGFSVEKGDAGGALTDGRPVFVTISAANYLDGRNVSINFRNDMPHAVDRLVGGLLSNDWETIAPYVEAGRNPEVKYIDLRAEVPERPADARLLFPNVGYRQQLGTLVEAHIFSRLNTDLTLANKLRIWIDGHQGEFNIPEAQQVRFYNPESGLTYIARRYGNDLIDGKIVDRGVASRMLDYATKLQIAAFEVERDVAGEVILDQFGQPTVLLDENGDPILTVDAEGNTNDNILREYRLYVGVLDAAVQVANLVGYGPFAGIPQAPSESL